MHLYSPRPLYHLHAGSYRQMQTDDSDAFQCKSFYSLLQLQQYDWAQRRVRFLIQQFYASYVYPIKTLVQEFCFIRIAYMVLCPYLAKNDGAQFCEVGFFYSRNKYAIV